MKLKFLSIIILTAMLASTLISCAGDSSGTTAVVTTAQTVETTEETTTETELKRPELPENDYGGYEFRFLSRGDTANEHWKIFDVISTEDKTGDVINDAVYERNLYIDETFNAKITQISDANNLNKAKTSILAASDDFDIFGDAIQSSASLASSGLLIDLTTVPHLNLDEDWWDQNAKEQLSIANKLYTMVNKLTLLDKHGTWIIMFTKSMIDKYNFENPYDMVLNNTWTLDKMYDMCTQVSFDVDGDGVLKDEDSFGTVGESWNANSLMAGAGTTIFAKDDNDLPVFTMNNERVVNAFEKVNKILADKNLTAFNDRLKGTYTDLWTDGFGSMMEDGRALFYITGMNRVILMRGLEADFGIIPNPKYDEEQENYWNTMSYGNTNSVSIPITCSDIERTGVLLEALTFESSITSYPAYIDTSIKTKYSRDEESVAMLDIIFASRVFDLGFIYAWGTASGIYAGSVATVGTEIASKIAKAEAATISAMEKTVALYQESGN